MIVCTISLFKNYFFLLQGKSNRHMDLNNISLEFNETNLIFTIEAPHLDFNINFSCPYNCKETYIKKSDLLNHLIRVHDHNKDYSIEYRYHCWQSDCPYNKKSNKNKYFTERKYINQHFNKVHRQKVFHCDKCELDFATSSDFNRHHNTCNMVFLCEDCNKQYSNHDRLLVHFMRHHPEKHKQYKASKKAEKRKAVTKTVPKKPKMAVETLFETDSPKRSFATQTNPKDSIKNDIALPSWQNANEISTQTGFEDLLSVKSNSEDESLFYSETTLSDIHTQTFPLEFGLVVNRSHKETLTESIDMSIKGTQTCCFCDSPKLPLGALESVYSSPRSGNLTSTETQTAEYKSNDMSDVLLSLNSAETQTCFDEAFKESL